MTSTPLFTKVKILLVGQEIPYTLSFDEAAVKAAFSYWARQKECLLHMG